MRDRIRLQCKKCKGNAGLQFCKNCASLVCQRCLHVVEIEEFECPSCLERTPFDECPNCNIETVSIQLYQRLHCPFCDSTDLGEPNKIIEEIPKIFINTLKSIEPYGQKLLALHKRFDRIVAIIRIARHAGFFGYPSIESDLSTISEMLSKTTKVAVDELDKIRKVATHVVREMRTMDISDLELYPFFMSHLSAMAKSVEMFKQRLDEIFKTVSSRFDELSPKLKLVLFHRENFETIRHVFPPDVLVTGVIATLINVRIAIEENNLKKIKMKGAIVFLDKGIIVCSQQVGKKQMSFKFPYDELVDKRFVTSLLKEMKYLVDFGSKKLYIFGTPAELYPIAGYFDWVLQKSNEDLAVKDARKIQMIDISSPDGSILKRSIKSLLDDIFSLMNGTPPQKPTKQGGVSQLKARLGDIDARIDYLVKEYATHSMPPQPILDQIISLKEERNHLSNQLRAYGSELNMNPVSPMFSYSRSPSPSTPSNRYGNFNKFELN